MREAGFIVVATFLHIFYLHNTYVMLCGVVSKTFYFLHFYKYLIVL